MEPDKIHDIPVEKIKTLKINRRIGGFDEKKLKELAASIESVGVLNPVIVRPGEGGYEMVCGERRLRALKIAGLPTIPAFVREMSDDDVLTVHTIENLHRDDLHPLDEAEDMKRLMELADYSVSDISTDIGKSEAYIYQRLKLLTLIDEWKIAYLEGDIKSTAAMLICRMTPEQQLEFYETEKNWLALVTTTDRVKSHIQYTQNSDLSQVGFDLNDPMLPEIDAGPCNTCPKNGNVAPYLFDEFRDEEKILCTDKKCLEEKLNVFYETMISNLDLPYSTLLTQYMTPDEADYSPGEWQEGGDQKGIIVDGIRKGTVVMFSPVEKDEPGAKTETDEVADRRQLEYKIFDETHKRLQPILLGDLGDYLEDEHDGGLPEPIVKEIVRELLSMGSIREYVIKLKWGKPDDWATAQEMADKTISEMPAEKLPYVMAQILLIRKAGELDGRVYKVFCECFPDIDYDEVKKAVEKQLSEKE